MARCNNSLKLLIVTKSQVCPNKAVTVCQQITLLTHTHMFCTLYLAFVMYM